MRIVNIYEAKTHLSQLIKMAVKGQSFIIAKAGRPMVKVMALDAPIGKEIKRFGFMAGQIKVPDDFNQMGSKEIGQLFGEDN